MENYVFQNMNLFLYIQELANKIKNRRYLNLYKNYKKSVDIFCQYDIIYVRLIKNIRSNLDHLSSFLRLYLRYKMANLVGARITCRNGNCYNKYRAKYVSVAQLVEPALIRRWSLVQVQSRNTLNMLSSDNRPAFLGVRIIQWWDKAARDVTVCCDVTINRIPMKGIYWYLCCSDLVQSPTTGTGRGTACVVRNLWSSVYGAWYEVWKTLVLCVVLLRMLVETPCK